MMSGDQFLQRLKAQMEGKRLVVDQQALDRTVRELEAQYPFAQITVSTDGWSPSVSVSSVAYTCMVHGAKMVNVTHSRYDKKAGGWVPRTGHGKRYHDAMCPDCDPTRGGRPLLRVVAVKASIEEAKNGLL